MQVNLNNLNYKHDCKPDNETLCIHKDSSDSPNILKQIATLTEKRIFISSCNKSICNESKDIYQKALEKSRYRQTLKYQPANKNVKNKKLNIKRVFIWINPPFNVNLKIKVGNYFLNLIRKHFPVRHKFSKLLNHNTAKVSYSCMRNVNAKINKYNKNTLEKIQQKHPVTQLCNCTNKKESPLNGQCLTERIIYQANITAKIPGRIVYLDVSETTFKVRYGNHKNHL